jgi:hypothetical protein
MTDATRNWRSVASSSDGSKLVAVVNNGFIYTSTDSGVNWTARMIDTNRSWVSVASSSASSSDGTKLVAAVGGLTNGNIYTSTDSGVTWVLQSSAGTRLWSSVASSSDGTKLVAAVAGGLTPGNIYTSADSGLNWTLQSSAGTRVWNSVASSADASKLFAASSVGIYTGVLIVPPPVVVPIISVRKPIFGVTHAMLTENTRRLAEGRSAATYSSNAKKSIPQLLSSVLDAHSYNTSVLFRDRFV